MAHHAFDLDKLAAGAFEALGKSGDLVSPRDLPTDVGLLLLAEVGLVVVPQTHVALELGRERDMAQPTPC